MEPLKSVYLPNKSPTHQVLVHVIESEAGWGQKVDEERWYESLGEASAFVKRFNAMNDKDEVPSWYMRAEVVSVGRKAGMVTIKTDQEYADAIQQLLKSVGEYVKYPESLVGTTAQERLLFEVVYRVRQITQSEPHLRGAVLKACGDMVALDREEKLKREVTAYREMALNLREVLAEVPTARLGLVVKARVKHALTQASKL